MQNLVKYKINIINKTNNLTFISASDSICLSCAENRVLNTFNQRCQCEKGFKENETTKECKKCYFYEGECLSMCPLNTVA